MSPEAIAATAVLWTVQFPAATLGGLIETVDARPLGRMSDAAIPPAGIFAEVTASAWMAAVSTALSASSEEATESAARSVAISRVGGDLASAAHGAVGELGRGHRVGGEVGGVERAGGDLGAGHRVRLDGGGVDGVVRELRGGRPSWRRGRSP